MYKFTRTFAVALVLVLTATGLWAAGAGEAPAAAADKEMVTDPTTGKVVTAPEYGGTMTYPYISKGDTTDPFSGFYAVWHVDSLNEKLARADWGIDRDVWDFSIYFPWRGPALTGWLAESWEAARRYNDHLPHPPGCSLA